MTPDTTRLLTTGTILALALMLGASGTAYAAVVCSEPLEPICVGNEETYGSDPLLKRCQADVEKFVEETEEYIACLDEQTKAKREEAEKLAADFRERAKRNQD